MDVDAPTSELLRDHIAGAVFFETEFGKGVNIPPDGGQRVMMFLDMLDRGHEVDSLRNHVLGAQPFNFVTLEAQDFGQHGVGVFAEEGRWGVVLDFGL